MEHQDIVDDLGAFHDNELPVSRGLEIRAHLDICAECREVHERWEKMARAFFHSPIRLTNAQTEVFTHRVMAQVKPSQKKHFLPFELNLWRVLIPALSFGLTVFVVFAVFDGSGYFAPMDALLLVSSGDKGVAEFILPADINQENNLLASIMEGR